MHASFKILVLTFLTATVVSCSGPSYQKTPGGMPYQLIRSKDTQQARIGSYIKLTLTQKSMTAFILQRETDSLFTFRFRPSHSLMIYRNFGPPCIVVTLSLLLR